MSYRIAPDEEVQEALRRLAAEQIDEALDEIEDESLSLHGTVHQVRKRCKKLRGALRLVRPALGPEVYRRENAALRDASRGLSSLRDAEALRETLRDLREAQAETLAPRAFDDLDEALRERRDAAAGAADGDGRMETFVARLRAVRERSGDWKLRREGAEALTGGLRRTYARGRRAMAHAQADPSPERFHEWRKRSKYGWYHLRLLRDAWRGPLEALEEAQHALSDLLGDDHDLAVLIGTLEREPELAGSAASREALLGLAARRRRALQAKARPLGARLYAEKPKAFARRMGRWTAVWRGEAA